MNNNHIDFNALTNEQLVALVKTGLYAQNQYDMKKALDDHFDRSNPEIKELINMMDIKDFAVTTLYEKNRGLINSVINAAKTHLPYDDVVQFANEGFYIAIQNYDASKSNNALFSTYAYRTMEEQIQRKEYRLGTDIHVPREKRQFIAKIKALKQEYLITHHQDMSDEECAKALKISLDELHNYYNMSTYYDLTSLDKVIDEDDGTTIGDLIADDNNDNDEEAHRIKRIETLLDRNFSSDDKYIICSIYGMFGYQKKSEQDIANEKGLTRSRVSQIKLNIERKLVTLIKMEEKNERK